jgi:Bacterial protein of unknown function (DUF945)
MVVTRADDCQPARMLAFGLPQAAHGTVLKKGIVALLVALALVILVSPGIIGRLAERSLEEDLDAAPQGTGEVIVTPQGFQRGWFSSAGRHRIELRDGRLAKLLRTSVADGAAAELPALIVDTRLDHGLIPFGSMSREQGSLAPGLGSAVSTLQLEWPDGRTAELPGAVYSTISLGGELKSRYTLPAGSYAGGSRTTWGDVDIKLTLEPSGRSAALDVTVDSASFARDGDTTSIGKLAFSGSTSRAGDGRLAGRSSLVIDAVPFAGLGSGSLHASIRFEGIDAAALDDVVRDLERSAAAGQPPVDDAALRRFVASGLEFDIEHFDIGTADGPISNTLHLHVKPVSTASFSWPSVLLALDAGAELRIPAPLFDRLAATEPQLNTLAGLGYLRRDGDFYELHAAFEKGVLTVNDAPISIPPPNAY